MSKTVVRVVAIGFFAALAFAQEPPSPKQFPPPPDDGGKVATAVEPTLQRFRITTEQGVFVVYDGAEAATTRTAAIPQIAYWNDFATEQLFFFDQLLYTDADVLQSIATMQRDLQIDPALLLTEMPELDPLPEITSPGQWRPAIEADVLSVMAGGIPGARDDGEVSAVDSPCVPGNCPDPQTVARSGPLAAPVRGTASDELFVLAQRGSNCICGGGGGCSSGCPDPDICQRGHCENGSCVNVPISCNDNGNLCTEDSCDPATGCVNTPIICDDPDACTQGQCVNGNCLTDSYCQLRPQCCGKLGWCCGGNETCCEYYWSGNAETSACCPPERPICLQDRYCCPTDKPILCGTTCCASAADCCNGDCRGECETYCDSDGWHSGPPCGSTWCPPWQTCCNGACCGNACNPGSCVNNQCITVNACEDGNECTDDPCIIGQCGDFTCMGHPNKPNGSSCPADTDECTDDICTDGVCTHPCKANCSATCPEQNPVGWCEACACTPETCSIFVSDGETCPGRPAELIVSGGCSPECVNSVTWQITSTSPYITGSSGSVACAGKSVTTYVSVAADTPLGSYPITIIGTTPLGGACVNQAIITVTLGALMSLNPTFLPATTDWPGMPDYSSEVTVEWNPPDCEGQLEIAELQPLGNYLPLDEGSLTRINANLWHYGAFREPETQLCPADVKVWLAATTGDTELDRQSVLVRPVHVFFSRGEYANISRDFNYLTWKYAWVLQTSGGTFAGITLSTNACIPCPRFPLDPFPPCVPACTACDVFTGCSVTFGTDAFGGTENQAASIIGHEMVHAALGWGPGECPAYQWEEDHRFGTGIAICSLTYLQTVLTFLADPANECP